MDGGRASPNIAGESDEDAKLWNTYLFWARSVLSEEENSLGIGSPEHRVPPDMASALQSIVFSAFVLEYRLKRIAEVQGIAFRKRDTLGTLIGSFQLRICRTTRMDNREPARLSEDWDEVVPKLKRLNEARNNIAHANYRKVLALASKGANLSDVAAEYYNAVVDAIRILNVALGYYKEPDDPVEYYKGLKVRGRAT